MSKLKVDEIRSADRSVSSTANIALADDGKVGIGTTAPVEMLEVYNATSPAIQLNDGGDYQAIMRLAGNDLEIRGSSGVMEFYNGSADGDSSTLRMAIKADGKVGIGTDSPGNQLHVSGDSNYLLKLEQTGSTIHMMALRGPSSAGLDFACDGANNRTMINSIGSGDDLLLKVQDGAHEFKIASDGKLFSLPTYNNTTSGGANIFILHTTGEFHRSTSSRRYKTNIVDSAKGLDDLLTLRPVDFTSLCNGDDPTKLRTGFIAEEVAEAGFEEYAVRDVNNEVQNVEYGHMVALCIKAIQELSAKVTELENK
tara:strand:+ start:98 stop:1030 length:933 start_codon:yes stop_codon:yes gene_type:complete